MKLMETLPIVFVAVAALAVLALDDAPAYEPAPRVEKPAKMVAVQSVPAETSLSPNEALVTTDTVEFAPVAPKEKRAGAGKKTPTAKAPTREVTASKAEAPRSRLHVEARRLHPDERLRRAVMGAITRQPNLSGQIAVEARNAVVRLSGWTVTPGQSLRAEKAAARVDGVRHVVNEIRPRMGVITS
jgi:hypothetical protein